MSSRRQRAAAAAHGERSSRARRGSAGRQRWTLREQFLWTHDADRTSMRAVIVLRVTVVLFAIAFLVLSTVNAVWTIRNDLFNDADRLDHYRFPWEVGVLLALVPLACLTCMGPKARTGSALFYAAVLSALWVALFWCFSRPYYMIVCTLDLTVVLACVITGRRHRASGRT